MSKKTRQIVLVGIALACVGALAAMYLHDASDHLTRDDMQNVEAIRRESRENEARNPPPVKFDEPPPAVTTDPTAPLKGDSGKR